MTPPLENTGTVSDSKCCLRSIFQTIQKLQILQPPERYKSKFLLSISLNSDKLQYFATFFGAVVALFFRTFWVLDLEKFCGLTIDLSIHQPANPGPNRHVSDGIPGTAASFSGGTWGLILGQTQRIPARLKPRRLSPTKSWDFLCVCIYIYILLIYVYIYIYYPVQHFGDKPFIILRRNNTVYINIIARSHHTRAFQGKLNRLSRNTGHRRRTACCRLPNAYPRHPPTFWSP